jgi:hypothetical protein
MLRPLPLVIVLIGVATGGCIAPAKIATVDSDATLPLPGGGLSPIVVTAVPQPVEQPLERLRELPAPRVEPLPLVETEVPATVAQVREPLPLVPPPPVPPRITPPPVAPPTALPPPPVAPPTALPPPPVAPPTASPPPPPMPSPPSANPPGATAPETLPSELSAVQRVRTIQQISLDISPADSGDPMLREIAPPTNYAAEALPQLAAEHPFYRGDLIDYGMYDNTPQPGGLDLAYQPLYFQELNAERYGRSWGVFQPAVSVANFYGRIPLLPYMAFSRPARRSTYHAHWALPGYKIPCREPHDLIVSPAGGAAQTAALIGIILLIP